MIYVSVKAYKSEGRGAATGNGWHNTDDMEEAIAMELKRFHRMWDRLGHGAITTYTITVAPEASPKRTTTGAPLPVAESSEPRDGEGVWSNRARRHVHRAEHPVAVSFEECQMCEALRHA